MTSALSPMSPGHGGNASGTATATTASEANVILPPPSALNPIPSLSVAFRLDNQEQLLNLLFTHPHPATSQITNVNDFRQLLVFGDAKLRTLLMRQVLQDPHTRQFQNTASKNKKKQTKNWDDATYFPLPKLLQTNVIGAKVLLAEEKPNNANISSDTPRTTTVGLELPANKTNSAAMKALNPFGGSNAPSSDVSDIYWTPQDLFQHVDVITYFVRPYKMNDTMAVIRRIQMANASNSSGHSNNQADHLHHRVVYIPQMTAMVYQVLRDSGVAAMKNVFLTELQLDLFPLETDLISMEYEMLPEVAPEGMPSPFIQMASRALSKLQDVTGTVHRIQSLGSMGEEVLTKMFHTRVDEYIAASSGSTGLDDYGIGGGDNPQQGNFEMMEDNATPVPVDDSNNVAMLIIDRKVDMVTPMVTPLTYEGLLDQIVGIDTGFVHLQEKIIHPPEDDDHDKKHKSGGSSSSNPFEDEDAVAASKQVALGVHAGDTLYQEVRDQHVEKFGSFLQNQAIALKESHSNFTSKGTKKDLNEIHQFVKQIPIFTQNLRSLTNHIHLAELIKATTEDVAFREQWNTERAMVEGETCYDILEECIFSSYPPYKLLRLMCLQSLASGGIKANRYDSFRQYIVQVYGYQFLPVLHDLEKLGWIKRKDTLFLDSTRSPFQSIKRNLILIHAEVDTVEPDDVSYVSSGYAPLSVRLVQLAMQGWGDKDEVLRDLFNGSGGGRLLDVQQKNPPQDLPSTLKQQTPSIKEESLGAYAKKKMATSGGRKKPSLVVVYLGGVTYMEIAALRFLSKRDSFPYHIVIVTTKVTNGSKLIQQLG